MEVLIVGAGSMGTWFGDTIDVDVTFADINQEAANRAAAMIDGNVTTIDGSDTYEAVCIAVPLRHVTEAIEEHAERANAAILDISGSMAEPVAAMRQHASTLERVSLHPLFAPPRGPGSIPVVRDRSGPVSDKILDSLRDRGNYVFETTPADHDSAMESVQAATHTAILSFALAATPVPDEFETPVYSQLRTVAEQLTEGTPQVYADIQRTFDGADSVAASAKSIAAADDETFISLFREAATRWQPSTEQSANTEKDRDVNEESDETDVDANTI